MITSGISSKTIKIRDDSLLINGKKHGTVINSEYQTCPLLSDYLSTAPPATPFQSQHVIFYFVQLFFAGLIPFY